MSSFTTTTSNWPAWASSVFRGGEAALDLGRVVLAPREEAPALLLA